MNRENTQKRPVLDVYTDVENAICNLSTLPSVLQLIIDGFHLDEKITDEEMIKAYAYDLFARRDDLYKSIYLVRNIISDTVDQLRAIRISEEDPDDAGKESEV